MFNTEIYSVGPGRWQENRYIYFNDSAKSDCWGSSLASIVFCLHSDDCRYAALLLCQLNKKAGKLNISSVVESQLRPSVLLMFLGNLLHLN